MCVCVCVYLHSHVSGGKFYLEKIIAIFSGGKKLLHVRGNASIPFEWLNRRLYLPTCSRKFCNAIKLDNIGENAFKIFCLPRENAFWLLDKKHG